MKSEFKSGKRIRPTLQIGYINRNRQICLGTRGAAGNREDQDAYMMVCLMCGNQYGANGCDVGVHRCPKARRECQSGGGKPGLDY